MTDHWKPIKVVQVIARMNVGGPAVLIDIVHRGLAPSRFDAQLWTGDVEAGELDYLSSRSAPVRTRKIEGLGRSPKVLGDVKALITLFKVMRRERPDIVHTHTAKAGVLGRLAAVMARVPYRVHTFHGHVLHGYFSPRITKAIVVTERVLARRTHVLAAVGSQVRDDLLNVKIGRPEQYRVVPPGVEISSDYSKTEARRALDLPLDAPIILFAGRLTHIKRPDRLIEAMTRVLNERPETTLAIAGEGDLLDETKRLAKPIANSVRFLGWQSDLSSVYPLADLVVLTSDNEGMPVTLIEASMLGIPCVTTDVGSAREVVLNGETGRVVATNSDDVAAALLELLSKPQQLEQFGSAARRHAEEKFGSSRLIANYASIYRDLTSQGR